MTPPGGTTGKGQWLHGPVPPKDYYSPKACANCHGDSGNPQGTTFALNFAPPINPQNLEFLPSPSDCPDEIFWPDSLKTPQDLFRKNSFMREQNFLDTLLRSRQGEFPLEVKDTSLGFYLGLKGPTSFPKQKIEVPHDASLCAGPLIPDGTGIDACQGLDVDLKDEDIRINLEGLELVNAQNLGIQTLGVLGIQIKQAYIHDGRLLATVQLSNPFLNAAMPFAYGSDLVLNRLPPTVQKILRAAKPNPYDPELNDIDVTDLLLEKIPVAYRVSDGKGYTFDEYQAEPDKLGLKAVSYLFNIAREHKLPAELSVNQTYEAVTELLQNIKSKPKTEQEKNEAAEQMKILAGLLDTGVLRVKLHPNRILMKNLFAEFDDAPGKNQIDASVTVHNLNNFDALITAPIQISRLYSPGAIDLFNLKGDLGVSYHSSGDSEFRLDNLQMDLGHLEYIATKEQGPPGLVGLFGKLKDHFKTDATPLEGTAILGGRITNIPDLVAAGPLMPLPSFRVVGNPMDGFNAELNLRMDAVQLRLPGLGEVTLNGDVHAKAKIVKRIEVLPLENGKTQEVTHWTLAPNSLSLRLEDLDIKTAKGLHYSKAALEISDIPFFAFPSNDTSSPLTLKLTAPEISGGDYSSLRVDGILPIPKSFEGYYDFASLAEKFSGELMMNAIRVGGNPELWDAQVNGSILPDSTRVHVALDSKESDPAGTVKRYPVRDLQVDFQRDLVNGETFYNLKAAAKQIDFPGIQLNSPKFDLNATQEMTKNGGTLYTVPTLSFTANPWKTMAKQGLIRGPLWVKLLGSNRKPLSIEIDGVAPTFEMKNLNLDFGVIDITHSKLVSATKGLITGVDIDGALRGHWKMDYDKFTGKGMLVLAGDSQGEGDIHLRGADGERLVKDDPRDPTRTVEIPIFSKTTWTLWNIRGVDPDRQRINGAFQLSTKVDPAFARVFGIIIDNGKLINWQMNHDHLPYTPAGYTKKMEEYISTKAAEDRKEKAK